MSDKPTLYSYYSVMIQVIVAHFFLVLNSNKNKATLPLVILKLSMKANPSLKEWFEITSTVIQL